MAPLSWSAVLVLIAAACVAPSAGDTVGETGGDDPLPSASGIDVPGPDRAADRSTEELAGMLQAVVDSLRGLHALDAFAGYDAALAEADASCPGVYTYGNTEIWEEDCETAAGARFFGYGTRLAYEGLPIDDGYYTGVGLVAACDLETTTGERYLASGYAYTLAGQDSAGEHTFARINGQFQWSGAEAAGTWVAAGLTPHLRIDGWHTAATGARRLLADGSVALSDDLVVDLQAVDLASDAACAREPSGALSLRESDGTWYDLAFDPDGACDGCAAATREGRQLGLVCASFATLVDWSQRPW